MCHSSELKAIPPPLTICVDREGLVIEAEGGQAIERVVGRQLAKQTTVWCQRGVRVGMSGMRCWRVGVWTAGWRPIALEGRNGWGTGRGEGSGGECVLVRGVELAVGPQTLAACADWADAVAFLGG